MRAQCQVLSKRRVLNLHFLLHHFVCNRTKPYSNRLLLGWHATGSWILRRQKSLAIPLAFTRVDHAQYACACLSLVWRRRKSQPWIRPVAHARWAVCHCSWNHQACSRWFIITLRQSKTTRFFIDSATLFDTLVNYLNPASRGDAGFNEHVGVECQCDRSVNIEFGYGAVKGAALSQVYKLGF